jgi:hypothetical protein
MDLCVRGSLSSPSNTGPALPRSVAVIACGRRLPVGHCLDCAEDAWKRAVPGTGRLPFVLIIRLIRQPWSATAPIPLLPKGHDRLDELASCSSGDSLLRPPRPWLRWSSACLLRNGCVPAEPLHQGRRAWLMASRGPPHPIASYGAPPLLASATSTHRPSYSPGGDSSRGLDSGGAQRGCTSSEVDDDGSPGRSREWH